MRGKPGNAQVPKAHGEIRRGRRGIVGQKKKWFSCGQQRLDKFRCTRDELIFAVDDPVHVDQISQFHKHNPSSLSVVGDATRRWTSTETAGFWQPRAKSRSPA